MIEEECIDRTLKIKGYRSELLHFSCWRRMKIRPEKGWKDGTRCILFDFKLILIFSFNPHQGPWWWHLLTLDRDIRERERERGIRKWKKEEEIERKKEEVSCKGMSFHPQFHFLATRFLTRSTNPFSRSIVFGPFSFIHPSSYLSSSLSLSPSHSFAWWADYWNILPALKPWCSSGYKNRELVETEWN